MIFKWLIMCLVIFSCRNSQCENTENIEESETRFKRNHANTNAEINKPLNITLSPQKHKIEQINKPQNQASRFKTVSKPNRLDGNPKYQPGLISNGKKLALLPVNTLNNLLNTNKRYKRPQNNVKIKLPISFKSGPAVNKNLTTVQQTIHEQKPASTINNSLSESRNITKKPVIEKKENKGKKFKYKTILVKDDDNIEDEINAIDVKGTPFLNFETKVLNKTLSNVNKKLIPKYNKNSNKTLTVEGGKINNITNSRNSSNEVDKKELMPVTKEDIKLSSNNRTKPTNDTKIPSSHKENIKPISKNKDFTTESHRKSLSSEEVKAMDPDKIIEEIKALFSDKETKIKISNLSPIIKIPSNVNNKTSLKPNRTEDLCTLFEPKLNENMNDRGNLPNDSVLVDQPVKVDKNQESIKNGPQRNIIIEATNFEEIHERYDINPYQMNITEKDSTQDCPHQPNFNYGQKIQYPHQYGSYQTIPYYTYGNNYQYNNCPGYQSYRPPYYGNQVYNQNPFGGNVRIENYLTDPAYSNNESPYIMQHYRKEGNNENPLSENRIVENIETFNTNSPHMGSYVNAKFNQSPLGEGQKIEYTIMDPVSFNTESIVGESQQIENSETEPEYFKSRYRQPYKNQMLNFIPVTESKRIEISKKPGHSFNESPFINSFRNHVYDPNFYGTHQNTIRVEHSINKPVNFNTDPRYKLNRNPMLFYDCMYPFDKCLTTETSKEPVCTKIKSPTYNACEQNPRYKDTTQRKWKNTHTEINDLKNNKPLKIEMAGLNTLNAPWCYKNQLSDATVVIRIKTNIADRNYQ